MFLEYDAALYLVDWLMDGFTADGRWGLAGGGGVTGRVTYKSMSAFLAPPSLLSAS